MTSEISELPRTQNDVFGSLSIVVVVIACTITWCILAFCLTMAEHIPGTLFNVLNKYFCTRTYSILFGFSILIDGVMGTLAYAYLFDRRNLLMSKAGALIAFIMIFAFVLFQFFFFSSANTDGCTYVTLSNMELGFLIAPIVILRYLIYQPIPERK